MAKIVEYKLKELYDKEQDKIHKIAPNMNLIYDSFRENCEKIVKAKPEDLDIEKLMIRYKITTNDKSLSKILLMTEDGTCFLGVQDFYEYEDLINITKQVDKTDIDKLIENNINVISINPDNIKNSFKEKVGKLYKPIQDKKNEERERSYYLRENSR